MKNNHIGEKFGKWTIIGEGSPYYYKGTINHYRWKCVCECGFIQEMSYSKLRTGSTRSCKPCFKQRQKDRKYFSIYDRLFFQRVTNTRKKIEIKITATDYYNIAKNDCFYCEAKPTKYAPYKDKTDCIYVNGVDRVDSSKGYELTNCVPCCYSCNTAKNSLTSDEFFKLIERIYNKHIKDKKK